MSRIQHIPKALMGAMTGLLLSGCTNLSGLDARDKFACPVPDGILCADMKTVYERAKAGQLPSQQAGKAATDSVIPAVPNASAGTAPAGSSTASSSATTPPPVATRPLYSGLPIRSTPQILRIWINAWVDADGDLHDQSYLYVMVQQGQWVVEHNRRRIGDIYGPVLAPSKAGSTAITPLQPQQGSQGRTAGTSPLPMEVFRQTGNNILPPGSAPEGN